MTQPRRVPLWRRLIATVLMAAAVFTGVQIARELQYRSHVNAMRERGIELASAIRPPVPSTSTTTSTTSTTTTTTSTTPTTTTRMTVRPSSTTTSTTSTTTTTTSTTPTTTTSSTVVLPIPTPPTSPAQTEDDFFAGLIFPRVGYTEDHRMPVYEGSDADVDKHALELGLAHRWSTAFPGQGGNTVIGGHRSSYKAPFGYLITAQVGDEVTLVTTWGRYTYVVYNVVPDMDARDAAALVNQYFVTQEGRGETLTLYTCNDGTRKRTIVQAVLVAINGIELAPVSL